MSARALAALLAIVVMPISATADLGDGPAAHHAPSDGALPASARDVELVGSLELTDTEAGIGDVAALGTHAYLAGYAGECFNDSPTSAGPGIHVVDFSIPQLPRKVGFIPSPAGSYTGEGVQAMRMRTSKFNGDVLLVSLEPCSSSARKAGIALYDVTDPAAPVALSVGKGDRSPKPANSKSAHSTHSAFMWQAGKRAYAVLVDNEEGGFRDVDILDITNPRRPRLIAETGGPSWRGLNRGKKQRELGNFPGSFHHDVWVKKVGRKWLMLVSYWDSGWVVLDVTNPRKPRYVKDSNYPARDRLTKLPTEGNAHQAVWSNDNRFIIGANEDLFAKFTFIIGGPGQGTWFTSSSELRGAKPIGRARGFSTIAGPTVYAGLGCPPFGIPSPANAGQTAKDEIAIAVLQEGVCDVADKVNAAEAAGYRAVILASSHTTAQFGAAPETTPCAEGASVRISVLCIGHRAFHQMFHSPPNYVEPVVGEPQVGSRGDHVRVITFADGTWGDLRLLRASNMKQIGQHQIAEALDPRFQEGGGALSIHEIKVDPRRRTNLVYASWYGGGLRVLSFGPKGLREVGHYTDGTQDYWGVYPVAQPDGPPLLLMSDMNHGLVILRYTG